MRPGIAVVLSNQSPALNDLMIITESRNTKVNYATDEEANVFNRGLKCLVDTRSA